MAHAGTLASRAGALVGRDEELLTLVQTIADAPSVAIVEGEPGIGKTRLVSEAVAEWRRDGVEVLVGRSRDGGQTTTLGPVLEALSRLSPASARDRGIPAVAGALHHLLPELRDLLPPPLEPLGDANADRHRVFRAIRAVLEAAAPVVLVQEDFHWADPATAELVSYLLADLPNGTSLVVTYRPDSAASRVAGVIARAPTSATTRITLSRFGVDEVFEQVRMLLHTDLVSQEFIEYLHSKTSGLPLAVEEVISLLRARRDIVERDGRWERRALENLDVPAALRDSILSRAAHLPPDAQRVLAAVAVLAGPTDEDVVAAVLGTEREVAAAGASAALASGLLIEPGPGSFAFHHDLARQAVYASLPGPVRRSLHRQAAVTLREADPSAHAPAIAVHVREAGELDEWVEAARTAATQAMSLSDDARAVDLLLEVLTVSEAPPNRLGPVAVQLAQAGLRTMRPNAVIPVLTEFLDANPGVDAAGELLLYLAMLFDQRGETSTCHRLLVAAYERLLPSRPDLAARACASLALPWAPDVHVSEHLRWLDRIDDLLPEVTEPRLRVAIEVNRATALTYLGDPRADRAHGGLPASSAPDILHQVVRGHVILSPATFFLGRFDDAAAHVAEAATIGSRLGYDLYAGMAEAAAILVAWGKGRWDGIDERARALIDRPDAVSCYLWTAHLVLGALHRARIEPRLAELHLTRACSLAPEAGSLPGYLLGCAELASLRLERGRPDDARKVVDDALDAIRRKGLWAWGADAAVAGVAVYLALGDEDAAARLVQDFDRGTRSSTSRWAEAARVTCKGLLAEARGDAELAATSFAAARELWAALPRPLESLRAEERRICLGGFGEDGVTALLECLSDGYRALGARSDDERLRAALRDRGVAVPQRRGRKGYGNRLSPREHDVVRLVREGRTNREIASLLFLSQRTVEDHVSRAMKKLGAPSRAGLAELPERERPEELIP